MKLALRKIKLNKLLGLRVFIVSLLIHEISVIAVNGEMSFTNPGPGGGSFIMSIAFHPSNPDIFYMGGDIEGPFLSTNGGNSYSRITGNLAGGNVPADVYAGQAITLDPQDSELIYMASWGGLFRSGDRGTTWTRLLLNPELEAISSFSVASVAVSPVNSSIILVGSGDVETNLDGASSIFRSIDGGTTFTNTTESVFLGEEVTTHWILFDTTQTGVVYAATGEGILKSSDDGETWAFSNTGLPNGTAGAPIVHGLVGVDNGGVFTLYATLRSQSETEFIAAGVYRSTDGAATWQDITSDLPRVMTDAEEILSYSFWHIVVSSADPNVVYIGTQLGTAWEQFGVYKTTNAASSNPAEVTWTYIWDVEGEVVPFTDMGWLDTEWWNDRHVGFLGISPSNPDILFAGSDHMFKSIDAGATWSEVYSQTVPDKENTFIGRGIECMEPFDIAFDPNDDDRWWVGYDDMGLWRTDDAGASFVRIDPLQNEPGSVDCACFVVADPIDSNIIYVGRNGGENDFDIDWQSGKVYKSTDSGATWERLGEAEFGNGGEGGRPFLLMLPGGTVATRTLFAAIYGQGLFKSTDSGATWAAVNAGFEGSDQTRIWTMVHDPNNPGALYAGITDGTTDSTTSNGGVYKSTDEGLNWSKLSGTTAPSGQVIDLALAGDGTLYAATAPVFTLLEVGTGTRQGGLYRSTDGGDTWTRVLEGLRADYVDVAPTDPNIVVVGVSSLFVFNEAQDAGTFISHDGGQTFQKEMNGLTHTRLWMVKFHPNNNDLVFVGTGGGGLFAGTGALGDGGGIADPFGGVDIDGFPGWKTSPWYLNYNVDIWPWIFHDEHGWQFVFDGSTEEVIFLWDLGFEEWIFLNQNTYRWEFLFNQNGGWIWTFDDNAPGRRFFQRIDDGSIFSLPPDL